MIIIPKKVEKTIDEEEKYAFPTTPLVKMIKDAGAIRISADCKLALSKFATDLAMVYVSTVVEQAKTNHPKRDTIDMFDCKDAYELMIEKLHAEFIQE